MISVKLGARVTGLRNEVLFAIMVAESIYRDHGYDVVITAGTDGSHSRGSEHYKGDAVDIRTRHMEPSDVQTVGRKIGEALGPEFDVVVESTHIHIEFDPKTGINSR